HEIQRFVQSAEQLGHFAGVMPQAPPVVRQEAVGVTVKTDSVVPRAIPETPAQPASVPSQEDIFAPEPPAPRQNSAIVPRPKERKRDRPQPPKPELGQQRLFTEQPEGMRPLSKQLSSRPDLGNLWLATTILLVIFTAFGAGFLIMRPLLNR
ncbi:MAG: hypothetical protein F6K42_10135, partial [Leptolyngbya sp. SIO1D8]|nr:hypothetical protein [Leptolyngbya sp. SIO1D8]